MKATTSNAFLYELITTFCRNNSELFKKCCFSSFAECVQRSSSICYLLLAFLRIHRHKNAAQIRHFECKRKILREYRCFDFCSTRVVYLFRFMSKMTIKENEKETLKSLHCDSCTSCFHNILVSVWRILINNAICCCNKRVE